MWHTPKGIIDEGGMMLDGYLNFNISLLAPPVNNVMSVSMRARQEWFQQHCIDMS